MATRSKDSSPTPGREKKSTSSPSTTKRLTKSRTTVTEKSLSTSSAKQVPNYLRPTLSASRHENLLRSSSAGAKKHGPEDHAASQNPTLNRRRSFDKPPSASRIQKALISPGRDAPLRSSSFSAKISSNAPRPRIERTKSSTLGSGKPQLLPAKSVKKSSTSSSVKKESSSGSTRAPKSKDIMHTLNLEVNLDAIVSLEHHEVEEVGKISTEEHDKVILPDPKGEESEHFGDHDAGVSEAEANSGEDEKVKASEGSNGNTEELKENVEERNKESRSVLTEKEEKPGDNDQQDGEENAKKIDESGEIKEEEGVASEDQETKVEMKEEQEKESDSKEENEGEESKNVEEKALDEKEREVVVDGGVEEVKPTEAGEAAVEVAEETPKPRQVSGGSSQGGGKKDSAPAYNDVIEETTNKLMEKRKNKVKALVGAFETVIDYESK
ncbi:hypothetical protein C1H46_027629 [Malus baccata]|uniref:Calmodulin-binding domain-containing protein n=1 Tax=Malus baccata TaxID=106549 RepID=A0A540LJV6_MALBA|nr:hypothetical protein C1H46_027629 [Malus baccata]